MKVSVDLELCTGHARCQVKCPEVYGTDDVLGKCVVLMETVPEELRDKARRGARACPERAITVTEE